MKYKFISHYLFVAACAFSTTSAFASNSTQYVPTTQTSPLYYAFNGTNNKLIAAVDGETTSFKFGLHLGSSNNSLDELDVSVGFGFTFETGFFYNSNLKDTSGNPINSVADGALITIGNRLDSDGKRVFDEGTLKMSGGSSATELVFRGEEREVKATYHIGTSQEMKMANIRTNVGANNIVHLYNASYRSNAQISVAASSELYLHLRTTETVNGVTSKLNVNFGTSNWNGKFQITSFEKDATTGEYRDVAFKPNGDWIMLNGTHTFDGQKTAWGSSFGSNISKVRIGSNYTTYVKNSEVGSIILGTNATGAIALDNKATLKLASSNAFAANSSNGQNKVNLEPTSATNSYGNAAKLILEKAFDEDGNQTIQTINNFNIVYLNNVAKYLRITLGGNKLTFNSVLDNEGAIGKIYIDDFGEGLFQVNEIADKFLDKEDGNKISFIFAGTDAESTALYWNSDTGYVTASPVVVPEPAQWAIIFGAIALAFVAYRRRK